MTNCIICGKENGSCLCDECRQNINPEQVCYQILGYTPAIGENEIWDNIAAGISNKNNFKNIIFAISAELPFPRKEYMRILCLAGDCEYVAKNSREWLYNIYDQVKASDELTMSEKNRIRGLVMAAYVMDYRYQDAEEMAAKLAEAQELPKYCYYTIGNFYTKTRRYELAEEILVKALEVYQEDLQTENKLKELLEENTKRRTAAESGKKEYMPAPKEAKEKYEKFMSSIGIEVALSSFKGPKHNVIPKDQYPEPVEERNMDFDSFVAFDVETTGFSTKIDSIIEIGAIKVINGQIVEEKEFTFQEFVKPYKRSVSAEITELTGITADDVKEARQMWEVIPDFLDFIGDMVLVGYNSMKFDSQFLARAGRYSNRIIINRHFDVMRYLERNAEHLGLEINDFKLGAVSEYLGIEVQEVHRAYSDSMVAAKIFMKLKEMNNKEDEVSIDDLLSDIDEW